MDNEQIINLLFEFICKDICKIIISYYDWYYDFNFDECNICYDEKKVNNMNCCIGKKWCEECEIKSKEKSNKCPFCRKFIISIYSDSNMDSHFTSYSRFQYTRRTPL